MSIIGTNSILNQYSPTYLIKNARDGQVLVYNSAKKAFVNAKVSGSSDINRISDLLDVDDSVGNPALLVDGQVLAYSAQSRTWMNSAVKLRLTDLIDTDKNAIPDGFLRWDNDGGGVIYQSTLMATDISGLSPVATSGSYLDLGNLPDLTVNIIGDAAGSGTGTINITLTDVNSNPGTFGGRQQVPVLSVNTKGQVTSVGTEELEITTRDLIQDTLVIKSRHQYIVTGQLEIEGRIENYGRIAIL